MSDYHILNLIEDAFLGILAELSLGERARFERTCKRFHKVSRNAPLFVLDFNRMPALLKICDNLEDLVKDDFETENVRERTVEILRRNSFLSTISTTLVRSLVLGAIPLASLPGFHILIPNINIIEIQILHNAGKNSMSEPEEGPNQFQLFQRLREIRVHESRLSDIVLPRNLQHLTFNIIAVSKGRNRSLVTAEGVPSQRLLERIRDCATLKSLSVNFFVPDLDGLPLLSSLEMKYNDSNMINNNNCKLFKKDGMRLDRLDLRSFMYRGPCPDLRGMEVDRLYLRQCEVQSPEFLSDISPKVFFTDIGLFKTEFFADKSQLVELYLTWQYNKLNYNDLLALKPLKNLKVLHLVGELDKESSLGAIEAILGNIEDFSLQVDPFYMTVESDLSFLDYFSVSKLRSLSLRGLMFQTSKLSKFTNLTSLSLSPKKKTPMGDPWLKPLGKLTKLRQVELTEDYGGSDAVPKLRVSTAGFGDFLSALSKLERANLFFATVDTEYDESQLVYRYRETLPTGAKISINRREIL